MSTKIPSSLSDRLKSPLGCLRRPQLMMSLIILTGQHLMVSLNVYFSVHYNGHRLFCRWLLHGITSAVCFSTAQEQSNIYPSHSYNTSLSPAPNSVSPPVQEDLGGPRKNVDPNMQEHSVVNFPTATTSDTVTLHTGKAIECPLNLLSPTAFKVLLVFPCALIHLKCFKLTFVHILNIQLSMSKD